MQKDLMKKTKNGLHHGLIDTQQNSVDITSEKKIDESVKEEYKKRKKHDSEIISVRYINHEGVNDYLETPYLKYPGDPITKWRFLNNHEYKVPRGLVNHVNDACKGVKKVSELVDQSGSPLTTNREQEKIHEFVGII